MKNLKNIPKIDLTSKKITKQKKIPEKKKNYINEELEKLLKKIDGLIKKNSNLSKNMDIHDFTDSSYGKKKIHNYECKFCKVKFSKGCSLG